MSQGIHQRGPEGKDKILLFSAAWERYKAALVEQLLSHDIKYQTITEKSGYFSVNDGNSSNNHTIELHCVAPSDDDSPVLMDATILWCWKIPEQLLLSFHSLKWVQTVSAGVDQLLFRRTFPPDVLLTNASGFHGQPMTEYVIGAMTGFAKGLFQNTLANQKGTFFRRTPHSLAGKTLALAGAGTIARDIAMVGKSLKMKTIGLRKREGPRAGFDDIYTVDKADEFFTQADILVILLPLTEETYSSIDRSVFKLLPSEALIINVGRGGIVHEKDLLDAIDTAQIQGAVLDVWEGESPKEELMVHPKILLTPHCSGYTHQYIAEATGIFSKNLLRYMAGERLVNVIDIQKGY